MLSSEGTITAKEIEKRKNGELRTQLKSCYVFDVNILYPYTISLVWAYIISFIWAYIHVGKPYMGLLSSGLLSICNLVVTQLLIGILRGRTFLTTK